jgi:hypothetical protein
MGDTNTSNGNDAPGRLRGILKQGTSGTFDLGPIHIPLPKWAVCAIAALVVLFVALELLPEPIRKMRYRYQMGITTEQDMIEAQNHFFEKPVVLAAAQGNGGELEARLYQDGCAVMMWRGASINPKPHFVRKITSEGQASPGQITGLEGNQTSFALAAITSIVDLRHWQQWPNPTNSQGGVGGRCVDQHSVPFQLSYGQQNGCWIQVWRTFQDGCVQYQWFNTCANYWDVNPDGSPKVFWTRCVH